MQVYEIYSRKKNAMNKKVCINICTLRDQSMNLLWFFLSIEGILFEMANIYKCKSSVTYEMVYIYIFHKLQNIIHINIP